MYRGQFKDGDFHGFGIYQGEDGSQYQGNFSKGSYHGYGQLTFSDGTVHSGEFKKGLRHGSHIVWSVEKKKFEHKKYKHGEALSINNSTSNQPKIGKMITGSHLE